ncbi:MULTISPECIES: AtpZ/AtpI family protein [Streptosporangium]|nr:MULTISPECIES: AtpZ/AtpI family protein [unclassified Streptosporangium]
MSEKKIRPEDDGRDFASAAWSIPSYLLSGMILYGGAGWLLSEWTGVVAFTPIGLILGVALSVYLVYRKYGR